MAMPLQAYSAGPHKQMFDLMECPITAVFHSKLKQRYFLISILFPLFRLPIRCLKNPILPSPNSHLENTQMVAISCFLRLWHSSPSSKVRPERHHHWNLLILLVKKSLVIGHLT
ncbi:hypothetical protein ES288_A12G040900v1 [Gossypium darwinii]|uniref:Uncharacterized protein n=1 Tax=Gossypium darwinii TaxID=34276 RepID=A0A5D2E609_GOSDA|nr:hypothetical protein ES288_A12G040900v1 [Gossypium darwinii]